MQRQRNDIYSVVEECDRLKLGEAGIIFQVLGGMNYSKQTWGWTVCSLSDRHLDISLFLLEQKTDITHCATDEYKLKTPYPQFLPVSSKNLHKTS